MLSTVILRRYNLAVDDLQNHATDGRQKLGEGGMEDGYNAQETEPALHQSF